VRDVSARRAVDQRMRNMSHLLDSITEAVYLVDPDTLGFTYVNAAACAQTGYDEPELLDMTPQHLLPELPADALRSHMRSLESTTGSITVTTVLRRRNGADVPVECVIDLPPALRGQPLQLVMVVRDIAARLTLEAETRAARELVTLTNDRERIARDLHDTVIQDLFASGLTLNAAAMRADGPVQQQIMDVVDRHDDIIRKVRVTIFGLTHRQSSASSLRDQAQTVVDEAARILGFAPTFGVSGPVDAASTTAIIGDVVPVLREALSNVARHANATRVAVELEHSNGMLTLRVADNGIGLPERPDGAGHGLHNLAQRATLLGGAMTIADAHPSGTVLTWVVPA
jgi:PAS domain S-box-containing protein